jgi:mono/diheme cytochrome c family protein
MSIRTFTHRARRSSPLPRAVVAGLLLAAAVSAGCRQDMHDTPRYEPLEQSDFFADRRAMRPLVEGTVARGMLRDNELFYTGGTDGELTETLPPEVIVDAALLERGQTRYNIYCAPCHSQLGDGDGMVVQRGYKRPASFHEPRLREERIGYFYDVITNGFGQMPSYAASIAPADRWAVAAYLRALQLSQHASIDDVPEAERGGLDGTATPVTPGASHEGGPAHE